MCYIESMLSYGPISLIFKLKYKDVKGLLCYLVKIGRVVAAAKSGWCHEYCQFFYIGSETHRAIFMVKCNASDGLISPYESTFIVANFFQQIVIILLFSPFLQ